MTMVNVVFGKLYPADYTSNMSTMVSNSLLVGAILGQISVGLICDRIGRKVRARSCDTTDECRLPF